MKNLNFKTILVFVFFTFCNFVFADYGQAVETPTPRVLRERIAAFHRTIVFTDEAMPNSGMLTYLVNNDAGKQSFLVKIVPGIEKNGKIISSTAAKNIVIEDFPGGVFGDFVIDGVKISTEILPLCEGQEAGIVREGAALYKIKTEPKTPIIIGVGSEKTVSFLMGSSPVVRNPNAVINNPLAPFIKGELKFRDGNENLPIVLKTSGKIVVASNQTVKIKMKTGEGYLLMTFAEDFLRAEKLAELNVKKAEKKVADYYKKLAENKIETPEPLIDKAFETAIYTLEYSWLNPFGWMECPHHWLNMWHMQCVAGANWIGQTDRSKVCTLHFGENLMPGGAVPHIFPNGKTHRTFGGSDQFYCWQARHLWKMTGDTNFAKKVSPMLDKVIKHAFKENDDDGNLLLAWGRQIGNQEDFIATPYDGTSPSIEGINMMRTCAELAKANGDLNTAKIYDEKILIATSNLFENLWLPDLGRFAYFVDPLGNKRLDGQYHTFIYPLLWNVVDGFDGYTSLRHLCDRLTSTNREVYCSNNFPKHIVGTHGYQAGTAQQPWAAWGFSAAGLNEETWQPLKAVSEWVADINHRGAWPEVSAEHAPGYFSPPAGLFIASVAEALFGLKPDLPKIYIEISPSFPSNWPFAKMELTDYKVDYKKSENKIIYEVETTKSLARKLRWKISPMIISSVLVDGKKTEFSVKPGVGFIELFVDVPASKKTVFTIISKPLDFKIDYPKSIAEGEEFILKSKGVEIVDIDDRYNIFSALEGQRHIAPCFSAGIGSNQIVRPEGAMEISVSNKHLHTFSVHPSVERLPRAKARGYKPKPLCGKKKVKLNSTKHGVMNFDIENSLEVNAKVQHNLLAPYLKFGRLGQLNFSRRTFFIKCREKKNNVEFWLPIDLTILPRFEACQVSRTSQCGNYSEIDNPLTPFIKGEFFIRNNTEKSIEGKANLFVAETKLPIEINIPARSEKEFSLKIPGNIFDKLSSGDNFLKLILPQNQGQLDVVLTVNKKSEFVKIPIDVETVPENKWREMRNNRVYHGPIPWGTHSLMSGLVGVTNLTVKQIPGLNFTFEDRKFIPISAKINKPLLQINLKGKKIRKLYILMFSIIDNNEMFSKIAKITVRGNDDVIYSRELHFPGDVDWWMRRVPGDLMSTAQDERETRFGLLEILKPEDSDFVEGKPPTFPQSKFWASSLTVKPKAGTLNIIEIDLGKYVSADSLTIETIGSDAGIGLLDVVSEKL